VGGSEGVRSVLEFLRDGLKTAMLLAGARRISDVNRGYLLTSTRKSLTNS
jgi:isopentenyl diphosphate isomerase/L-lactate dehydrogenase-like FMN-dependent dehydrogenase